MIRYCTELQSVQYLNPHAVSVQEEEHMKKESMEVVGRIVKRERELFGIRVIKKDNTSKVRQMYPEAWHMFYLLENENNLVPPLEIQGTMEVLKNDQILYVGISQSGTSVSTCEVMEYAKKNGYLTLAITGNLQSKITENTDISVHLLVGDELTPPETKGYTVSVLSVYLWAIGVAKAKNIYTEEQYQEALKEAADLVNHFQTVLDESEAWYDRNNASIVNSERIYVLGYGVDYGSMLEGVLKAGEMLRLPVLGYELEEYSHGPTMAIGPKQTILMIGSDEAEYERMLQFRTAYKKYTPRVHVITCKDIPDADKRDAVFSVKTNKYLAPLMYTVPFQFVAAKGAEQVYIDTGVDPFEESLAHYPKAK